MPTYQYACTSQACGLRFERVQAFTDPAISECPECSDRVRKVYGSVGVVFKGSGFYRTDSRNANTGAKTGSDGAAALDSGKGADTGKSDAGSGSGKADSSSGSAGAGESKSNGKSAAGTKPAATVAS